MRRTIACIVGARPNLVKMAPILDALRREPHAPDAILVHTGQHYDEAMSDVFFRQLGIAAPDVHLGVGSGTHGAQTAKILAGYETWLLHAEPRPAATLVVGDVNSTMACALTSVKLGVPVIHVEAGLRSFDRTMPEEINRIVTDALAELLLASEPSAMNNLRQEGHPEAELRLVGNVMIDALHTQLPAAKALDQPSRMGLAPHSYTVWTMHRPSNVDDPACLARLAGAMRWVADRIPVVFPVHPRTRSRLEAAGEWTTLAAHPKLLLAQPLGYLEFLGLTSRARLIVTDSGGLQEEATALGIPCLTMRENTERPITVSEGTSTLVGTDASLLERHVSAVLAGGYKVGKAPALWDGRAAERIAREVTGFLP